MEVLVEKIQTKDLDNFWPVFSMVLSEGFPGYSKKVIDYFLQRIYTKVNFDYWLRYNYKIILVAKIENQLVGFMVIEPYGGVCFTRWLGVLKEHRRKGVGRELINKWLELARQLGCHKVEIASQPEAKKFYEACGLVLEGKRSLSYFGIDQFIFGKVIGRPSEEVMVKY